MGFTRIPKRDIAIQVEDYLCLRQADDKLRDVRYFKLKYYDDETDEMLMLFIRKDRALASMQMWLLVGLCKEEDWTEDLENEGIIRGWLESKVEYIPKVEDWVELLRVAEEERAMYQNSFEIIGLPKGVESGIKNGGYKRFV